MPSLANILSDRIGPFPAWLVALGVGGGLYLVARHASSQPAANAPQAGNQTFSPFTGGGPGALFGSPAALTGPPLLPDTPAELQAIAAAGGQGTMPVDAMNPQQGAALTPNALYVPSPSPPAGGAITGGDNPFTTGYVGLRQATTYSYARGGPS